jgi:hypothetical protein
MSTTEQLIAQAEDADNRVAQATTQDERENWQRIAAEWWQAVCDSEDFCG